MTSIFNALSGIGNGIHCAVMYIKYLISGPDDCDFDDDLNPFCHWRNVNETLQFRRKYLWTGTAGTGPNGDHSNNTCKQYG